MNSQPLTQKSTLLLTINDFPLLCDCFVNKSKSSAMVAQLSRGHVAGRRPPQWSEMRTRLRAHSAWTLVVLRKQINDRFTADRETTLHLYNLITFLPQIGRFILFGSIAALNRHDRAFMWILQEQMYYLVLINDTNKLCSKCVKKHFSSVRSVLTFLLK